MSNITIKQYKIDYEFLINNYLDPSLWDKKWTLLSYRDLEWSLELSLIDTKRRRITFTIKLNKISFIDYDVEYALNHPEDTIEKLKRRICRKMVAALEQYEEFLIKSTDGYYEAYTIRDSAYDRLRQIAEDFLDENDVTNKEIREAYIDHYIDNNDSEYYGILKDYLSAHRYTELADVYYILSSVTDLDYLKKDLDDMLTSTRIAELEEELAEMQEYIESDQFDEDMSAELPEI